MAWQAISREDLPPAPLPITRCKVQPIVRIETWRNPPWFCSLASLSKTRDVKLMVKTRQAVLRNDRRKFRTNSTMRDRILPAQANLPKSSLHGSILARSHATSKCYHSLLMSQEFGRLRKSILNSRKFG